MSNDKYVNKDTYQTIQKVEVQSDFGAAIKPLWKKQENKVKEMTKDQVEERDGFLFSAKLIKKDSKNNCSVCSNILKQQDLLYETKYECCRNCYIQYVEGREERWKSGWRPKGE